MGTASDSTTAEFDLGTKSQSSNTRDIITISDVVNGAVNTPTANELQLENMFSDKTDVADSDAVTWKWAVCTRVPNGAGGSGEEGTRTANIDTTTSDKMYHSIGSASTKGTCSRELNKMLTGDFSISAKIDLGSGYDTTYRFYGLFFYIDANNYAQLERCKTGIGHHMRLYTVVSGVGSVVGTYLTSDTTIQLRIRRSGTTLYADYGLNQDDTYTGTWTKTGFSSSNGYFFTRLTSTTNNGQSIGNWHAIKVESGGFSSSGYYKTSGTFVGRTIDCGAINQKVTNLSLTVNCPSSSSTIKNGASDALEIWENTINDFATATKLDGWTNAELLSAGMTEGGADSTIALSGLALGTKRYKWYKLWMTGSGTTTPKVKSVITTYATITTGRPNIQRMQMIEGMRSYGGI